MPSFHKLLLKELGITVVGDFHLAHHLADDNLEVLVVNLHTLEAVNGLNFVHDILLSLDRSEYCQNVGRRYTTV